MCGRWRGLIWGAIATLGAGAASAQARVSVGPFVGQHAEDAEHVVAASMGDHSSEITWVPDSEYQAAAARFGVLNLAGEEDIARVGRELHLDAVIVGELTRRGRRDYLLRVRVLRGRDGATLGSTSWELHSLDELSLLQSEVWDQLHNYLRVDDSASSSSPPPPTPPPVEPTGIAPTPGLALATIQLAAGVGMRSWRVPVLGPAGMADLSPRGYENGGFAEGAADATLMYRWAHDRAGIGVSGGVVFPIALTSRGVDATNTVVSLPTGMIEGWGGAVVAYRPPAGGLFRFDAGVVFHSFSIDTSALPVSERLAPVTYTGARMAAEGVAPLFANANWEFGAVFGTELRVVAIGSEVRTAFGVNASTTVGLAGVAGIQMRLDGLTPGLAIRLTGEFLRYRTAFSGTADLGTASDSVDDYVRINLGISYGILTARARTP